MAPTPSEVVIYTALAIAVGAVLMFAITIVRSLVRMWRS